MEIILVAEATFELDGNVGKLDEDVDVDDGESSTDYQPLEEVIAALTPIQPQGELSHRVSFSSDDLNLSATSESLQLLHPAMLGHNMSQLTAMSGPLMYPSMRALAKLQQDRKSLPSTLQNQVSPLSQSVTSVQH